MNNFLVSLKKRKKVVLVVLVLLTVIFLLLLAVGAVVKTPYALLTQPLSNRTIGEIYAKRQVGQIFKSERGNLSGFKFKFATFGDRQNDKEVLFELWEKDGEEEPLVVSAVNAKNFSDHEWFLFKFPRIIDSEGKIYYATLRSPDSVMGNAVTIDYRNEDVYGGINNSMFVSENGGGIESFDSGRKEDRDTTFQAVYDISFLEYLKLGSARTVKQFILSVKNDSGYYLRSLKFIFFASFLAFILVFYRDNFERFINKNNKRLLFFVIILGLCGVGLRLMYINQMPYTNDEGFYLYDARTVLQGNLPGGDAIAKSPLFVGATAVMIGLVGNILSAGRLVSLIFGIVTAIPLYYLMKEIIGKRGGMISVAIWLLASTPALFNSYGHTQSVQMFLATLTLALLYFSISKNNRNLFLLTGLTFGISIISRKSSLALGLPIFFALLISGRSWKEKIFSALYIFFGTAAVLAVFLLIVYKIYGIIGVSYATGISLAKESINQLKDRGDLYATYSVAGVVPFFREAMPLIFLALIMLGQFLEKITTKFGVLFSRFVWIVPLIISVLSRDFIYEFDNKMRLASGIGSFWSLMPFLILLLAIFPLERKMEKANSLKKEYYKFTLTEAVPLFWFLAILILYSVWIKFTANYIAEFLPALSAVAAIGAVWVVEQFKGKRVVLVLLFFIIAWSNFSSADISFKYPHTGTFHWSAILEAAQYLKDNVPQNELIQTGAVSIPYISGHHVPFDASHPTWYAYGFIEPYLRNVFMAPAEEMEKVTLKDVNWFIHEKVTEFSYFREYPSIEKDIKNNFIPVKEIENFSNTITIYKRK